MENGKGIYVTLTWQEIRDAAGIGLARWFSCVKNGNVNSYGEKKAETLGADEDVESAIAEKALVKHTGERWSAATKDKRGPDVGRLIEVRAVGNAAHCLILHPDDNDESPFISVLVLRKMLPRVYVRGWVFAKEGKDPAKKFWRTDTGRPAFFVPADFFRPMSELETCDVYEERAAS